MKYSIIALLYFASLAIAERYYDPEIGCFVSVDPAQQFHNAYRYTTNPINYIDPDGLEDIVVTGGVTPRGQNEYEKFKYQFIETSIKEIHDLQASNSGENIAWAVAKYGYSEKDITNFQKTAEDLGVSFLTFETKDDLIGYMNTKNSKDASARYDDRITDFVAYGHGAEGKLWFDYGHGNDIKTSNSINFLSSDIAKLDINAFDNPLSSFASCNTGTGNSSFAQQWVNRVGGNAIAVEGYTYYGHINVMPNANWKQNLGKSFNRGMSKTLGPGYNPSGSLNYPTPHTASKSYWKYISPTLKKQ